MPIIQFVNSHTHTHTPIHTSLHTQQVTDVCSKGFLCPTIKAAPTTKSGRIFSICCCCFFFFCFLLVLWHLEKYHLARKEKRVSKLQSEATVYKAYHFVSNFSACCTWQESLEGTRSCLPFPPSHKSHETAYTHIHTHTHTRVLVLIEHTLT